MEKTLFAKIIDKELDADIVYEDDQCMAFHDVNPQAPTHVLLIPKMAIAKLADADENDQAMLGYLMAKIPELARKLGIEEAYRVVINNGEGAGQTIFHLHLHLLGGRVMHWPPG
jgi:histidine triad (HIT) family protein